MLFDTHDSVADLSVGSISSSLTVPPPLKNIVHRAPPNKLGPHQKKKGLARSRSKVPGGITGGGAKHPFLSIFLFAFHKMEILHH